MTRSSQKVNLPHLSLTAGRSATIIHPGEYISRLVQSGRLSVAEICSRADMQRSSIYKVMYKQQRVTPMMAAKLGRLNIPGLPGKELTMMQASYDAYIMLRKFRRCESKLAAIKDGYDGKKDGKKDGE